MQNNPTQNDNDLPASDALPSAHGAALLHRQDTLQTEARAVLAELDIARRLTPDTRLAILWIKEMWHALPAYHGSGPGKRIVNSRDIYDAVLHHGVRTPSDFDVYLRKRGKPAR